MYISTVIQEMKKVFKEVPHGIDHTLKVLKNAEEIMDGEGVTGDQRELIAIVAVLHDIGAVEAQRKHGSMAAEYQEKEGPAIAQGILTKVGYNFTQTQRVCHIVGNHHSPDKIDGLDFQIQWEADLLENLAGMEISKERLEKYIAENFRTNTGKMIAQERFPI